MSPTRSHEDEMAAAGAAIADALARLDASDPHEAALAAYEYGGPSVKEIEAAIRADRAAQRLAG